MTVTARFSTGIPGLDAKLGGGLIPGTTTAIVGEMSYASYGSLHRDALFSIGLILFILIVLINVVLNLIVRKEEK